MTRIGFSPIWRPGASSLNVNDGSTSLDGVNKLTFSGPTVAAGAAGEAVVTAGGGGFSGARIYAITGHSGSFGPSLSSVYFDNTGVQGIVVAYDTDTYWDVANKQIVIPADGLYGIKFFGVLSSPTNGGGSGDRAIMSLECSENMHIQPVAFFAFNGQGAAGISHSEVWEGPLHAGTTIKLYAVNGTAATSLSWGGTFLTIHRLRDGIPA